MAVSAEPHLPLPAELPPVDEPASASDGPAGGSLRNHEGPRERCVDDSTNVDLKTQIIRFTVTGGLSAVVDYGLYLFLKIVVGLPTSGAKAISFVAGTTTAYLINRRWTFQAPPSRARFLAVVALYATTFGVQVGLNQLMVNWLGEQAWQLTVAFVVAQGTATVINFVVQRAVIFKIH
ncbi:GtrA family protein [Nocardia sp. NPDC050710]|uniref:GtrA family protein n=1 Tax=Nocardia sp. NPDC050710 TaxID=3157220 RepID=UPI0033CCF102